jgi:hypothetical protein
MTEKTERETSRQRAVRLRGEARKKINDRAESVDETERALDEMIRNSIDLHGA